MDENIWNKIKETGIIPAYLDDIELEFQEDRKLRGYKPQDTHLLEAGDTEGDVREYSGRRNSISLSRAELKD